MSMPITPASSIPPEAWGLLLPIEHDLLLAINDYMTGRFDEMELGRRIQGIRQTAKRIAELDTLGDTLVSRTQKGEIAPETELASLRKLYGAKFSAISAALGWATQSQDRFVNGDEEEGIAALDKVVSTLADA